VAVQNLFLLCLPLVIIRDLTLGKDLMSAVNVGNLLPLVLTSVVTREFTLEKGPMSAVNVVSPLSEEISSNYT